MPLLNLPFACTLARSLALILEVSAMGLLGASVSPAWAQVEFDDAEAQLRVRQASNAAYETARKVEALRKALEAERQRVIQNEGDRDLNQATIVAIEQELRGTEARQREQDVALKAAREVRARGLAAEAQRRKLEEDRRQAAQPPAIPAAPSAAVSAGKCGDPPAARVDWHGCEKPKANLTNTSLPEANLRSANLREASLLFANLEGANLQNANLELADLRFSNLKGANLQGVNLLDADLDGATWIDGQKCAAGSVGTCKPEVDRPQQASRPPPGPSTPSAAAAAGKCSSPPAPKVDWRGCEKPRANLTNANLAEANLQGADLRDANLLFANLERANLEGANLAIADLRFAKLERANLQGANLEGATWIDGRKCAAGSVGVCQLEGERRQQATPPPPAPGASSPAASSAKCNDPPAPRVNWRGCEKPRANLTNANLSGAILGGANFRDANLLFANLEGANLEAANLALADLRFAKLAGANLVRANLEGAIWIDGRKCAAGSIGVCR